MACQSILEGRPQGSDGMMGWVGTLDEPIPTSPKQKALFRYPRLMIWAVCFIETVFCGTAASELPHTRKVNNG